MKFINWGCFVSKKNIRTIAKMSVAVFLRFFLQQSPPPWPSSFPSWHVALGRDASIVFSYLFSILTSTETSGSSVSCHWPRRCVRSQCCVSMLSSEMHSLLVLKFLFCILHCCQFLQYWLPLLDCWCAEVRFGRRVLPPSHTARVSRLLDSSYVVLDVLWQRSWKGSNGTLIFTPDNLFQVKSLQQEELMVEEECWWDWKTRKLDVKSRNLSATSWVTLSENSSYAPYTQNTNW